MASGQEGKGKQGSCTVSTASVRSRAMGRVASRTTMEEKLQHWRRGKEEKEVWSWFKVCRPGLD